MVWTWISLVYRTDFHIFRRSSITAIQHRDEVLGFTARFYASAVDPAFILKDNNACPCRAVLVYKDNEGIARMGWPVY